MPKQKNKRKTIKKKTTSYDSAFLFKLVIYLIIGSIWIKIQHSGSTRLAVPIGLIIGLFIAANDHFKVDRKIEYALLLIATLIGFWAQFGIIIKY